MNAWSRRDEPADGPGTAVPLLPHRQMRGAGRAAGVVCLDSGYRRIFVVYASAPAERYGTLCPLFVDRGEQLWAMRCRAGPMGASLVGTPRSATLVALGDVEATVLPVERFQRFLREHPTAAGAILADVIGRLRDSDRQRVESAGYDAPTRLAVLLLNLTEEHGVAVPDGGHSIGLPLSQKDFADAIGASRESVAHALATFRAAGLVRTRRRDIIVTDAAALRAVRNAHRRAFPENT